MIERSTMFATLVVTVCATNGVAEELTSGASFTFSPVATASSVEFVPAKTEADVPQRFRLGRAVFETTATELRTAGRVRVHAVRFPSPVTTADAANNTVHGRYFQPAGQGPYPAVVLLHVLDGGFALIDTVGEMLAHRGVAALSIQMPYYGDRLPKNGRRRMISFDPKATVENITQAVVDVRRARAWLCERPEVDESRTGIAGASLGGMVAVVCGAAEPRFSHVAVILGGGDVAGLIWDHPDPIAARFRRGWKANGGDRGSLERALAPIEPVNHARRLRNRKVLLVAASRDEIVPKKSSLALWKSLDEKPKLVWLEAGHLTAVRYLFPEVERLRAFLSDAEPGLATSGRPGSGTATSASSAAP